MPTLWRTQAVSTVGAIYLTGGWVVLAMNGRWYVPLILFGMSLFASLLHAVHPKGTQ